jgi:hypothetical protein
LENRRGNNRRVNVMTDNPHWHIEDDNLVSLLQAMSVRTSEDEDEDRYMREVRAFLSYLHETPETMLQRVNEVKTLKMKEELRKQTVRDAIFYLDSFAKREEISMSHYAFRSAVIGNFLKLIADHMAKMY